jgi:polyphosphate kinase 2 (PPK2 family)
MTRAPKDDDRDYELAFHRAQVELVKFQKHVIKRGQKVLLIFEGRDAAGKDGTIKRIVEHLSPRETRVVALGVPSTAIGKPVFQLRGELRLPVRSFSSIAVGTTARASSASWVSARMQSTRNS